MNKKVLLVTTTLLLLLVANASAFTMDINGGYDSQSATYASNLENGVICVPDDGNVTIKIMDANSCTSFVVLVNGSMLTTESISPWLGDNNAAYGVGIYDDNAMTACGKTNGTSWGTINVKVPTTEAYSNICVQDSNSLAAKSCEWVGVKPDSTYTGYTITNSDGNGFCKTTSYSTFQGNITDSTGYGKIETNNDSWDLSSDLDFDSTIVWANANKVTVTATGLVGDNAKLTFLKPVIHSSRFEIRRNDSGCSSCSNIVSNNGQVSFTTTSFSTYEILDLPSGQTGGTTYQPPGLIPSIDLPGIASTVGGIQNLASIIVIIAIIVVLAVAGKKK